jgi:hypothetical protein
MGRRRTLSALSMAALSLLAVGLLLPGRSLLECLGDGVARVACCCAMQRDHAPVPASTLQDRCCCDSVAAGPTVTVSVVPTRAPDDGSTPVQRAYSFASLSVVGSRRRGRRSINDRRRHQRLSSSSNAPS